MLRIGKLTDYAILIITAMAKDHSSILSASVLANRVHLPVPTVSKILKILAEKSLVQSLRGVIGGYHLARPAETITLVDVIQAMEGELALTECCEPITHCSLDAQCVTKNNWKKINKMVTALLAKFTLADMLKPLAQDSKNA